MTLSSSAPYQGGGLQSYALPGGYLPPASTYPNQILQLPSARSVCPDVCPLIFEPVCAASNTHPAHTFSNRCFLQMYNCKNNQNLRIVSLGPCRCSMH
ncbi:agrin [Anabrus simplex]|uniref:agrin n=1 Tax=Anabrus simplex TaxID=316456 RepID=UPI0035A39BF4